MKGKNNLFFLILSVILIAIFVVAGIWISKNKNRISAIFDGSSIYKFEDIEAAYNDGYSKGTGDLARYQATITQLQQTLATKELQLNDYKDRLQAMEDYSEENILLKNQIQILTQQIELANETIANYELLLRGYHADGKVIVNFLVNNESYYFTLVENGETINVPNPVVETNQIFVGWTINGTDIIDLSIYSLTSDTVFNAVIKTELTITFKVDNVVYSTVNSYEKILTEIPQNPSKAQHKFAGWSLDGTTLIDLTTHIFTSDAILNALFEFDYNTESPLQLTNNVREQGSLFSAYSPYISVNFTNLLSVMLTSYKSLTEIKIVLYEMATNTRSEYIMQQQGNNAYIAVITEIDFTKQYTAQVIITYKNQSNETVIISSSITGPLTVYNQNNGEKNFETNLTKLEGGK